MRAPESPFRQYKAAPPSGFAIFLQSIHAAEGLPAQEVNASNTQLLRWGEFQPPNEATVQHNSLPVVDLARHEREIQGAVVTVIRQREYMIHAVCRSGET